MRKVIAVLMMVVFVFIFYRSILEKKPQAKPKKDIESTITSIEEQLEEDYPSNPIDVVEIHNELVNILYNKDLKDEEVERIIELQRSLYGRAFLDLNPLESHIVQTSREIFLNSEKEIKVIGSKVMNSYNDPPGTMKVQVVHYTNKQDQDLAREYILEKEKMPESPDVEEWKIFGWENIGLEDTQEEE
ncbi:MAG: hypothetical protein GX366_09240 [Epulopiscium sp.]|nr:hypothetical protein [Candidatus Epulonipiscium sp.]